MRNHRNIDKGSLAFGRAIAAKLGSRPDLIGDARDNLTRWMRACAPSARPALNEWLAALDGTADEAVHLLTSRDERSTRLRQSNPFAGALTKEDRNAILLKFEAYDQTPT